MKKEIVESIWPDSSARVTIEEALNFTKNNNLFIAVNDGEDLRVGVEIGLKKNLNKEKIVEAIDPVDPIKIVDAIKPIAPMPIKIKAFQHQIKAYNMALKAMGVIDNAD